MIPPSLRRASCGCSRSFRAMERPPALRRRCTWPGCQNFARGQRCVQHEQLHHGLGRSRSPPPPAPPPVPHTPSAFSTIEDFFDRMSPRHLLAGMVSQCNFCGSWNFPAEKVGRPPCVTLCCRRGKASHLPALPEPPAFLQTLLLDRGARGRAFRAHIRRYNAAMSFISFGAQLDVLHGRVGHHAPPVCVLHGAVYHHSHELRPTEGQPRFAQLYLYDTAEASRMRSERDAVLDGALLEQLARMLEEHGNPYITAYRRMGELTEAPGFRTCFPISLRCQAFLHPVPWLLASSLPHIYARIPRLYVWASRLLLIMICVDTTTPKPTR